MLPIPSIIPPSTDSRRLELCRFSRSGTAPRDRRAGKRAAADCRVYLSAVLTNLLNNTTIAAVLVPVVISLAQADPSLNPVQLVLPLTLATTFGYSLPAASGRMALIAASGIVQRGEMLRYGLVMTFASSTVLAVYGLVIAGWI